MANYDLDDSNVSSLFKILYDKKSEATFNTMFPFLSRVKQRPGFEGSQKQFPVPLTFGGSVGSGTLPSANTASWSTAILTRKKVYARLNIDRETIYAAKTDRGAFVRGTKEYVRKTVESYTRNTNRILFGTSDGALGTITSLTGSNPYVCTITDATWKTANFEEQDYVNVETGNTDLFEITAVDPANKTVTLQRLTGSQVPVGTDVIFMQGSENNDPTGIETVADATSSTLFNISVARRWQSYQKNAASAAISPDLLNEAVLTMQQDTGKIPTDIVMSYVQFRKYLDQTEDQKTYQIRPRDKRFQALVSFSAINYLSTAGQIPIYPDRFVPDDRVYLLNNNFIEMHKADGFGWFDDDGTVLLRSATEDSYEARYGGYWEFFINPAFQGTITTLAT